MSNRIIVTVCIILFIGVCAFATYNVFAPISDPGTLEEIQTNMDPIQIVDYSTKLPSITSGGITFDLEVKARYKQPGLIVSTKEYNRDTVSRISPIDFGICWGDVPSMTKYMNFSQYGRFCNYTYKLDSPVDPKYVVSHMSNDHIIPGNPNVRKSLKLVKKGDNVLIEGYLVWVTISKPGQGTGHWNSSLRRDDYGNGACEIIYVTRLQVNDKVFE